MTRILKELPDCSGLLVYEVVRVGSRPMLGRCWSDAGASDESVGKPVAELLCEPDENIVTAFDAFVERESAENGWFSFLHDDRRVVGLVLAEDLPQTATGRARVRNRLDRELVAPLISESPVAAPFYAVLSREGHAKGASPEAPPDWATAERLRLVSTACARLGRTSTVHVVVPSYLVRLGRLQGDALDDVLAVFTPVSAARAPELAVLTPTQARVVRFAAAGATAPEIAQVMGRSAGTVRTHLREAYRRLEVASRLELQASSDELGTWGAR